LVILKAKTNLVGPNKWVACRFQLTIDHENKGQHLHFAKSKFKLLVEQPFQAGSTRVVLKFLSVNNMVIANSFTHVWSMEPTKDELIFHAMWGLEYFLTSS